MQESIQPNKLQILNPSKISMSLAVGVLFGLQAWKEEQQIGAFLAPFIVLTLLVFFYTALVSLFRLWRWTSLAVLWLSLIALKLFLLDVLAVFLFGPDRVLNFLGPNSALEEFGIYYLCLPAFLNVMILQKRFPALSKWYVSTPLCLALGVGAWFAMRSVAIESFGDACG